MTGFETFLMRNPLRRWLQRTVTLSTFAKLGAELTAKHVLEPGCGDGAGAEMLLRTAGTRRVDGFDLDRRELRRAQARAQGAGLPLHVFCADIAQIPVASASYDAVVCFGVIHHAPDWRHALRETYRVLRPGGQLCLEESYAAFISHPLWRRLMNHPEHDRPDAPALLRALGEVGFVEVREQRLGEYLGLVVCRRPA
ncbi:MAG TPA: class I SAM-dependent methyltransferase [Pseudomonadota bacterium]|nr:class I SAM-dependent methyltransferase [Pseudomonadota bacterium]